MHPLPVTLQLSAAPQETCRDCCWAGSLLAACFLEVGAIATQCCMSTCLSSLLLDVEEGSGVEKIQQNRCKVCCCIICSNCTSFAVACPDGYCCSCCKRWMNRDVTHILYNVQWPSTTAVGSPASTFRAIDVVVKCHLLGWQFLLLLLLPGKEHPQLHHL